MRNLLFVAITVLMVCASQIALGATWYVDGAVSTSGDGSSPETAFKTIREGINTAPDGDTVIVAEGTYDEKIDFKAKNIVLQTSDPADRTVVENTVIDGNKAGAVVTFAGTEDETCVLSGFTIRNGEANTGAGICGGTADQHTLATIENNVIADNVAQFGGGGLAYCDGTIRRNIIRGNSGGYVGGGGLSECDGVIVNNVIADNLAGLSGGGLYGCDGRIENNTIADNAGGGLDSAGGLESCQGTIRNCIIWGNRGDSQMSHCTTPTYSCIQDWTGGGEGNIPHYPCFVDEANGDYHLRTWSPCVDAGDLQSDYSLEPEPNGGRIDMGAYGNTPQATSASPDADWYVSASAPPSGNGQSWKTAFRAIQEGINAASEGHVVVVAGGEYRENIHFDGENIVLTGTDPRDPDLVAGTIIDGNNSGSVVTFAGTESDTCVLSGFTVRNGYANNGGGICGGSETSRTNARIECSVIKDNVAAEEGMVSGRGGGLAYCDGVIRYNRIFSNTAVGMEGIGGGLDGCGGTIRNNLVLANSARYGGGLAYCNGVIESTVISGNTGESATALLECQAVIRNSIIWGNTNDQMGYHSWDRVDFTYCCIQGWTRGGEGNISDNPLFVNGYHLSAGSPCIDAGMNAHWVGGGEDLDGNPRVFYGGLSKTADIGAYEYGSWPFRFVQLDKTPGGHPQLTWTGRPGDYYEIQSSPIPLTGLWKFETIVISQGESNTWIDSDATSTRKFYRIELR